MKIKTQVSASLIIFVILAVLIIFSVYSSNNQFEEMNKKEQVINEIEKDSFELYFLENEYLLHTGTRPVEQWNSKYDELSGHLKELTVTDPDQQIVLSSLLDSHAELHPTFSNLVALTVSAQGKEPVSASQRVREFAASTLTGQTQRMMSKSSELSQMIKAENLRIHETTTLIFFSSIAVLMIFVFLNYFLINRSVLRSVSTLQKGAKKIGTGDLDTKIETGTSDELGDLSFTITAMASNLKTVLTSKSELEKEIAERKLAEEALRESELRFGELFENMSSGVAIYQVVDGGNDFIFKDFNKAGERIDRVNRKDIIGKRISEAFPSVREYGLFEIFQRVWRTGNPEFHPVSLYRDNRISGWRENYILKLPSGEIVAIYDDVTEHKLAEEALRESEEKYREFFTTSRDCVFITSPGGQWIDFNDVALEMFGYPSREELSKVPIPQLYEKPSERTAFLNFILRQGYAKEFPARLRRKDGTVIDTLITTVPVKNPDGSTRAFVGTIRDITDRTLAEEKLKVSEELYRALVETTGTGYVIIDKDGKVLDANPEYVRLTGHHTLEEILGRNVIEWTAGYEKEKNADAVKKCARDGYIRNLEIDYVDSTGSVIPVEITATVVEIEGTIRILTLCRDITDRKRLEEALKESEERFRGITERISDLIIILDPEGYATFVSPSITSILGFPQESYIGKRIGPDIIWAEDIAKIGQAMERLKNGSLGEQVEFRMLKSDGSYAVIEAKGIPVFTQGIYAGVQVVARDITERKQAEGALRESERKFHTMADFTVDWEYWLAPDSSFVYISPSCEGITGYSPKEFIADPALITRIVYPDDTPLVSDHFRRIHESPEPGILDFRIVGRDGEIHWLAHTCLPVYDRSGTYLGRRASNRDINERKRAEQEIMLLNATLEQRVRDRTQELEQATETIRTSLDEKVILLREIHHRVKNNLQILISLLNLQSRTINDPQIIAALKESTQRIRAMSMVHENLYRGSDLAHIDFISYLSSLAKSQVVFYQLSPGKVTLETTGENIMLDINTAIPLGLVMNELLSNALKYAFPGNRKGTIRIDARKTEDRLEISIADDGVGLPEGFDYINSQSLGLRLVHILIEQISGTIELKKVKGTTFNIVVKEK
jgi:PAS domain S-box-containing protein